MADSQLDGAVIRHAPVKHTLTVTLTFNELADAEAAKKKLARTVFNGLVAQSMTIEKSDA